MEAKSNRPGLGGDPCSLTLVLRQASLFEGLDETHLARAGAVETRGRKVYIGDRARLEQAAKAG